MSFVRGRLTKLEKALEKGMIVILQQDGSVARFPQSALKEAFLRNMDFLRARADGEDLPEPHPLQVALQNAAVRESWHSTYFDMIEDTGPVEDLSED